jgi:hypothetical protein
MSVDGWSLRESQVRVLRCAISLAVLVALASPAAAQTPQSSQSSLADRAASAGSAYLPLGHWIYDYVDLMVTRGRLAGLSPLVQPYRRIDIARAVLAAERERQLTRDEMEWVAEIKQELAGEIDLLRGRAQQDVSFGGEFGVGFDAMSHTHRDPLRPEGEEKLFATLRLDLRGAAPGVAGALLMRWNNHYLNDPQFPDGRAIEKRQCDPIVDECAYRVEEAYVEMQLPYVRLFFGRMYRNWGLPGIDGLLLAPYAYSYDHLGYRFGSDKIALTGLYAPFNDFGGDTARHFSSHRFDWRILDNLAISVSESVVYGGENRGIDFNLTNPVGVWEISGNPEGQERNAFGMAEVWFRIFDDVVTYGAFLVDNTSVGDEEAGKESGFNQFAAAFSLLLPSLKSNLALRGDLTVVSSLAYRSRVDFWEYYMIDNIGLAHDKTDAIVFAAQADWFLHPRLLLKPRLDLMWKGEDDIRKPWPDDAFTGHEKLLVGTVENTIRPSVGGRYHMRYGEMVWDLGLNIVKNEGNVERDWIVIGSARVGGEVRVRFESHVGS